ncbi:MAG TPA: TlpA disulfide reductase family protein [Paenalcaligenes sp.]|nr:TlpA disulfide reductase family protein [Paenalcaligenes sp.]
MASFSIGPLAFSLPVFLSLLSLVAVLGFAFLFERLYSVRIERSLWLIAAVGVVAGRAAFVAQYWALYRSDFFAIIDIRDGGMLWQWTLFGMAVAMLLVLLKAQRVVRRGIGVAVILGLAVWGVGLAYSTLQYDALDPLPALRLSSVDKHIHEQPRIPAEVDLSHYVGKPVVLNLWATWCPPCRREMPVFQTAQQHYPDVHFVFANQRESTDQVLEYLRSQNLSLHNLLQDNQGELARFAHSNGLPTTLFIDATGRVLSIRMGEVSAASLAHQLERIR